VDAYEQARKLIGKSAGKICFQNIDDYDVHHQAVVQAAEKVWENMMSAWELVDVWEEGTTLWLSPGRDKQARVTRDGTIQIESLG
jgi:hypothetical protein